MMKVKSLNYFLIIFMALLAIPAMAQSIAYVDAVRLVEEAPQGKALQKELEDKFGARNVQLRAAIEDFRIKEAEFKKNAVVMNEEDVRKKSTDLRDLQISLQRQQQAYSEDYARSRNTSLAALEQQISLVIIEIAKQRKMDLVLQDVVYASESINLTDAVLQELNKRYSQ